MKPLLYYVSFFILIIGSLQLFITLFDIQKVVRLNNQRADVYGVVIDKYIQERFQGPQTGYRLRFFADSLNQIYENNFFKSYNDKFNQGDTLCVLHYPADPHFSRICNFRDAYSETLINLLIGLALLIAGWIGVKNYARIIAYLKGE